ncbi:ABC transporter permease [Stenoxybacter acetivorans]|uniref:ABC transporter permease n=1 Tax=Stenoxybacter acetivorans TaxID=422441 RepID=UPI000568F84D|nr:ABC transporter permease [Stenoxybacter acetivorans]
MVLLDGWLVQKRVIWSLFLRELKTRFGKFRLGYLWALIDPLAQIGFFYLIFGFIMHRLMPEISFIVFLANGIFPFMLFSDIAARSVTAIEANQGLLSYRPVRPIDTLLSRTFLESLIILVTYAITMIFLHWMGEIFTLVRFLEVAMIFILVILFSFGLGCIFMVVGNAMPESQKLIPILLRPLYFMSGIMYSPSIVPQEYRWAIIWNPLIHAFELLRHYEVPSYQLIPEISLTYLVISSVVVLSVGLLVYKGREPAMMTS